MSKFCKENNNHSVRYSEILNDLFTFTRFQPFLRLALIQKCHVTDNHYSALQFFIFLLTVTLCQIRYCWSISYSAVEHHDDFQDHLGNAPIGLLTQIASLTKPVLKEMKSTTDFPEKDRHKSEPLLMGCHAIYHCHPEYSYILTNFVFPLRISNSDIK